MFQAIKNWWRNLWAPVHTDQPVEIPKGAPSNPILPGTVVEKPNATKEYQDKAQAEIDKLMGASENDSWFRKFMVPFWSKLFGRSLGDIRGRDFAWCGLLVGVILALNGHPVQPHGEDSTQWRKYGQEINWRRDGIPRLSIVQLNHAQDCAKPGSNHVTFSAGDCTPEELAKKDATFNAEGGNQNDHVSLRAYPVAEICAVRFPPGVPLPGKITVSKGCSGAAVGGSTK